MSNRISLVTLLVLFLSACQPEQPTPTPLAEDHNKRGVHLLMDDGRNHWPVDVWETHMQLASQAVGASGWVTFLVTLEDIQNVEQWQYFTDLCAEYKLIPVMRLATTYDRPTNTWEKPLPDPQGGYAGIAQRYADFAASLDWPTSAHYVIVGNEPNHGNEWGGVPNPSEYAAFLIDVSTTLNAADPNVLVLNAGLDSFSPHTNGQPFPDGFVYIDQETFMDEMIASHPDVFDHIDVWSSHSYPQGPFTAPPWEQSYGRDLTNGAGDEAHSAPPENLYNRGINGYEWELWKLSTYNIDPLPVLITETGWRHAESTDPASLDSSPNMPDAHTVATYIDLSLHGNEGRYPQYPEQGWTPWANDPRVIGVTFFAFNGLPQEWGHSNWLALDETGQVLDVYPMVSVVVE